MSSNALGLTVFVVVVVAVEVGLHLVARVAARRERGYGVTADDLAVERPAPAFTDVDAA